MTTLANHSFTTHNDASINCNMSSLVGYIEADYIELIAIFGAPTPEFDDLKSDAEWHIKFDDDTIATIYNYKNGRNYLGAQANHVRDIKNWHVGGYSEKALILVQSLLDAHRAEVCQELSKKINQKKIPIKY